MNIKIKGGLYGVMLGLILSSPFWFYVFFEPIVVNNPLLFALAGTSYHFTLPIFSFFLGGIISLWVILFNIIFYYIFGFVFIGFYLKNKDSSKYINYLLFAFILITALFAIYNFLNSYNSRAKQDIISNVNINCRIQSQINRPDIFGSGGACLKKEYEESCKKEEKDRDARFLRCLNNAGYKNEIGGKI